MAVLWGSGAAVAMRIALDEDDGEGEAREHGTLMSAVRTILIADLA